MPVLPILSLTDPLRSLTIYIVYRTSFNKERYHVDEETGTTFYGPAEAAAKLSELSGRTITVSRLGQLRRAGKIHAQKAGYNTVLYSMEDLRRADLTQQKSGRKPLAEGEPRLAERLTTLEKHVSFLEQLSSLQDARIKHLNAMLDILYQAIISPAVTSSAADEQQITPVESTSVPATPVQASEQHKPNESGAAPEGFTWLNDFADLHGMSRNEANRRWQSGMIAGQKIHTGKRRAPVAISTKGKRDFWVQFHELEGFRTCDECPHS
jgi:hypothetical protein